MGVMDKLKTGATVVVLGVVLLAGYSLWSTLDPQSEPDPQPKVTASSSNDDNYVLSAKWAPVAMHVNAPVHIKVSVDGVELPLKKQRISPFHATMTAEKGARVKLSAWAPWGDTTYLDCVIMRNGRSVPLGGFDSRNTPGYVACEAS